MDTHRHKQTHRHTRNSLMHPYALTRSNQYFISVMKHLGPRFAYRDTHRHTQTHRHTRVHTYTHTHPNSHTRAHTHIICIYLY